MDEAFAKTDDIVLRITDMSIKLHDLSIRRPHEKTDLRATQLKKQFLHALH